VLTDFKQQDLSIQRFSGNQLFRSNDNEVYHINQYVDDTTGWQVISLYNRKYLSLVVVASWLPTMLLGLFSIALVVLFIYKFTHLLVKPII